jgi:hypothetical protein
MPACKRAFSFYSTPVKFCGYNSTIMSPSFLPWWGWFLSGLAALFIGYLLVIITLDTIGMRTSGESQRMALAVDIFFFSLRIIGWVLIVSGAGFPLISLVRFIKWAWAG